MQLTYMFSELTTGLRRNVSMTVAVVVTMFVSLTLVGMGVLLNAQAQKAEDYWGNRLQISVLMCTDNSPGANCLDGRATPAEKAAVEKTISTSPQVEDYRFESSRQVYDKWRARQNSDQLLDVIRPADMSETYWVTLKDPRQYQDLEGSLGQMPGVGGISDLRDVLQPIYFWISGFKWGAIGIAAVLLVAAILQVGNTIRLTAFARRREIGIMRLVGASSWYIQLPFLLEALVAALLGVLLAAGAIALFLYVVVYRLLRPNSSLVAWVDWTDGAVAIGAIAVVGLALTLIPTLLLTRKYLDV